MKIKKHNLIHIVTIVIVLLLFFSFYYFNYVGLPKEIKIRQNDQLDQINAVKAWSFISQESTISGVIFYSVRDYYPVSKGDKVQLSVRDENEALLRQVFLELDEFNLKGWNTINFEPIKNVKNKKITINLLSLKKTDNSFEVLLEDSTDGIIKLSPKVIHRQYIREMMDDLINNLAKGDKDFKFAILWFSLLSLLSFLISFLYVAEFDLSSKTDQ